MKVYQALCIAGAVGVFGLGMMAAGIVMKKRGAR